MTIPKIIHQLWIGPKPRPSKLMDTWREKHPDYEYIMWNEDEIRRRSLVLRCIRRINEIEEINGKADIIRWEILYQYGGIFIDADSICIEPLYNLLDKDEPFAGYENENIRQGLVATGTMAFPKNHPLPANAINWIIKNEVSQKKTKKMAWINVGPGLLTGLLNTGKFADVQKLPSYYFLPKHATGLQYMGHSKVYAYQEWGSTKKSYDTMNDTELQDIYKEPKEWVSVLVSSYNTNHKYIMECLTSIKNQNGHFGIELVWINDGSNDISSKLLEKTLDEFIKNTRFIVLKYNKLKQNMGIGFALHHGVLECSHEIIIKVDSDDVSLPDRFIKQIQYMNQHPDCLIVGSNAEYLKTINGETTKNGGTNHPELLLWEEYKKNPSHWFINHPCVCYRKSAIIDVGNYNKDIHSIYEDFDLELRLFKKAGKISNIKEPLILYRLHGEQVTANNNASKQEYIDKRNNIIKNMISN